jgi:hypothetical protein
MASTAHTTPAPAMQPGLRSFIVYDRLPEGCAAFPVTDNRNAPHLAAGDMVVIDTRDHDPSEGELFAVEWMSGRREVVETFHLPKIPGWCVGPLAPQMPMALDGTVVTMPGRWCDFPYRHEALADRLIGRVIGILEPKFAEPMRLN